MSYFEEKRFSNSMLRKVEYFVKNQIDFDKFDFEKKETTKSMDLGSLIHLALETSGKVFDDMVEYENPVVLSNYEKKMLEAGNTINAYFEIYNNKDSKKLQQLYEDAFGNIDEIKETKQYQIFQYIQDKIYSYLMWDEEIEKLEKSGKIVLNKYDSNPEKLKEKIKSRYLEAISNQQYQNLFICPNCEVREFPEQELYFSISDIPFKAKLDRTIINDTEKKVIHVDYKTYSDDYIKSFKKYNYARQISLYELAIISNLELLNITEEYTIEHYVLFIDTVNESSTLEAIARNSLDAGRSGGYLKTNIYDHYTELDELDVFLNEKQLAHLIYSDVIRENTKKDKHDLYCYGIFELVKIVKDNNLMQKFEGNSMFNL